MVCISKVKKKIRKLSCNKHDDNRDIEHYVLWHQNYKTIDVYICKVCKEEDDEWDRRYHAQKEKEKREQQVKWDKWREKQEEIRVNREISIKEDLWDCYVLDQIMKGSKLKGNLYYEVRNSIPKEVIRLARSQIRLQRLLDDKKKQYAEQKKRETLENENQKKLKSALKIQQDIKNNKIPVLICKHHGRVYLKDALIHGFKVDGSIKYRCKLCQNIRQKNYYKQNKDYVLKKTFEYRKNNPEKIKEIRANYSRRKNDNHKINGRIEK